MMVQSMLEGLAERLPKGLATTAGCIGILLANPLSAAEPAKVMQVQPITTIKTIQPAPVVTAPPVAMSKPDLPVMSKPITIQPITPGPIAIQPVKTVKPDVSLTPISPKAPLTPIGKIEQPAVTDPLTDIRKQGGKDAREDRRTTRGGNDIALDAKARKLKKDNESIKGGMDESRNKATSSMEAADIALATGQVSGAVQVGAGVPVQNPESGEDVESLVQRTLIQTSEENKADLREQMDDLKDKNAAKKVLKEIDRPRGGAEGKGSGKSGKTTTTAPVKAASAATPKLPQLSRPCTPINPC